MILLSFMARKPKKLLLVEDNELDSSQIAKILDNGDLIEIEIIEFRQKSIGAYQKQLCMIV